METGTLWEKKTITVFGRRFKFQIEAGRENRREKPLGKVGGKEQCQLVNILTGHLYKVYVYIIWKA